MYVLEKLLLCLNFSEETFFQLMYGCFRCCGSEPSAVLVFHCKKVVHSIFWFRCIASLLGCTCTLTDAITSLLFFPHGNNFFFLCQLLLHKTAEKCHPTSHRSLISSSLFRTFISYLLTFRDAPLQWYLSSSSGCFCTHCCHHLLHC